MTNDHSHAQVPDRTMENSDSKLEIGMVVLTPWA
eukprot:CAMPEP_0172766446 /NCGR_PEP_ID=MMETSP1074-20121228/181250_1 /TAXON_ID=2916 /ORGANISM="Ceratium fusus, Strain PA161109" /LENGTH=33 /DNA_ID= /DNA_START= /DNA_END= /DNA_ORIENTATION=